MKLVVQTFLSLDGVMQAPGGPDEDRDGGFDVGGWLVPYWSDEAGAIIDDSLTRLDALLLGRRTYEIFAGYWPKIGDEDAVAARFRRIPKFVLSTTLTDPTWADTEVLADDLDHRIAELKSRPGAELQVHGSASAVQTLLRLGAVDEFRILQAPVVLGGGKRLFGDGTVPTAYDVLEHRTIAHGATFTVLRPRGVPEQGLMGE